MRAWPERWRAQWVWHRRAARGGGVFGGGPVARPGDCFVHLCLPFELEAAASAARCRVTADGRYRLYLNGHALGGGPVRSEPTRLTYDQYAIERLLRPGRNVFAALVRHYGQAVAHWRPAATVGDLGQGGFLLEAEIVAAGDTQVVATGPHWWTWSEGYQQGDRRWGGPPPAEVVDGRRLPPGWPLPDARLEGWAPAVVCEPAGLAVHDPRPPCAPFLEIGPRPIPPLAERAARPRSTTTAGGAVVFDMGEIVNGHPVLEVDAEPGTVVDLAAGEDLDEGGRPVTAPRHWTLRYTAAGTAAETVESFEPVGFRYLALAAGAGTVRRQRLWVRERRFPRDPVPSFGCSDEMLARLWAAGARTLDLCSVDAFVDCPGRENRAWLGDAYIHTLLALVTGSDRSLARWNLQLHAQGSRADGLLPMVAAGDYAELPVTIPDYTLHWVRALARWWEWTGERELVAELLPVAVRGLEFFERHRGADGRLAAVPGWVFLDWAQTGRGHRIAALDALYAIAADDLAGLARALDDHGTARWARRAADRSRAALQHYWDGRRGVYVDAAGQDGGLLPRVSQHTNALAVLAGAVPAEREPEVLDRVLDEDRLVVTLTPADHDPGSERLARQWLPPPGFDEERQVVRAQPFFAHFVHQAVARAGRAHLLPALLRRWRPLLERGNGCLEEYWDAPAGRGSRAHAWSATPTYDLTTHVLGLAPAAPGASLLRLAPRLGDLEWAQGTVPTPHGLVGLRVDRTTVEWLEVPDGARVEVATATGVDVLDAGRHERVALAPGHTTQPSSRLGVT